jgi:hypothetical protein
LRATGSGNQPVGGILRLAINAPLRNTGGTIEALNGGRVEAAFARIEGGLIRALPVGADTGADGATTVAGQIPLGGMTIVNPTPNAAANPPIPLDPHGMILEGDLKLGLPTANQEATLIGEVENKGILRVVTTTDKVARLRVGEAARPPRP